MKLGAAAWAIHDALGATILGLWTALWISLGLATRLVTGSPRATLCMARRCWAPLLVRLSRVRIEHLGVTEAKKLEGVLVTMNHQSIYDILALIYILPVPLSFVAKSELRRVPFLGWHISAMGMVFVERGSRVRTIDSLRGVASILASGGTVVCFPEGKRSRDGRVGWFKTGVFVPAIEVGAPVVPAAINGTGRVLPPGGFRLRPGRIMLSVGTPIPTSGLKAADRKELAATARDRVIDLLTEDQRPGALRRLLDRRIVTDRPREVD